MVLCGNRENVGTHLGRKDSEKSDLEENNLEKSAYREARLRNDDFRKSHCWIFIY